MMVNWSIGQLVNWSIDHELFMSLRRALITAFSLSLCMTAGAQSPFVPEVTSFRALVCDFDETSGGYSPAWSPDGKQIAYLSAGDNSLWVAVLNEKYPSRAARHARLSLPQSPSQNRVLPRPFREMRHVDWSPDGNRLAFVGNDGGLWLAEGDTKSAPPKAQLTALMRAEESRLPTLLAPRWSPDGKRIAFLRSQVGSRALSLWLLTLSPRKVRQIFPGDVAGEPVWAPNGRWLTCTVRDREEGQPPTWNVWRISAEGDEPLQITREGMCSMPRWSPDGKRLAFVCTKPRPTEQENDPLRLTYYNEFGRSPVAALSVRADDGLEFHVPTLHVINVDAPPRTPATPLAETSVRASASVRELFEKTSKELAAVQEGAPRPSVQSLYLTAAREIYFDTEPSWSADGKHLAFVRVNFVQRGVERRCVWTMDVESKKAEPLTMGGGEFAPAWSPQGSLLLLMTKRLLALGERVVDGAGSNLPNGAPRLPRPGIERLESLPEIWLMQWKEK
jgi:Tol biopolymer transport system component